MQHICAVFFSLCVLAASESSVLDVSIVGGGLSGLVTAFRLTELQDDTMKLNITIYEKEDRVGGVIGDRGCGGNRTAHVQQYNAFSKPRDSAWAAVLADLQVQTRDIGKSGHLIAPPVEWMFGLVGSLSPMNPLRRIVNAAIQYAVGTNFDELAAFVASDTSQDILGALLVGIVTDLDIPSLSNVVQPLVEVLRKRKVTIQLGHRVQSLDRNKKEIMFHSHEAVKFDLAIVTISSEETLSLYRSSLPDAVARPIDTAIRMTSTDVIVKTKKCPAGAREESYNIKMLFWARADGPAFKRCIKVSEDPAEFETQLGWLSAEVLTKERLIQLLEIDDDDYVGHTRDDDNLWFIRASLPARSVDDDVLPIGPYTEENSNKGINFNKLSLSALTAKEWVRSKRGGQDKSLLQAGKQAHSSAEL